MENKRLDVLYYHLAEVDVKEDLSHINWFWDSFEDLGLGMGLTLYQYLDLIGTSCFGKFSF